MFTTFRSAKITLLVCAGIALAACSTGDAGSPSLTQSAAETRSDASGNRPEGSSKGSGPGIETDPSTEQAAPDVAADKHRTRGDKRFPGPEPLVLPWTPEVDVQTRVEPFCVEPGGKIHLEVVTPPKAAIAYHAVYADNKGGAPEPYGAGYGGNDDGFADPNGQFESDWVVSANAPFGPGRVDVIVGHDEKWGYDDPEFMVKKTC